MTRYRGVENTRKDYNLQFATKKSKWAIRWQINQEKKMGKTFISTS